MSVRIGGRVAVDTAPARRDPTGVGVYVARLAEALAAHSPTRVRFIGVRADGPVQPDASLRGAAYTSRHYHAWVQRCADRDARDVGAELVHYTNAAAPMRGSLPYVLTVHDLSIIRYARFHPAARVAMLPIVVAAIRRARALVVPSRATADEVRRLLHVPASRIHVVPHGSGPGRPAPEPAAVEDVLRRLGLEERRFIVATGTLEPRKNHARLIAAFDRLAAVDPGLRLVLVGAKGWRSRRIDEATRRAHAASRIVATGYLADAEVDALMAASAAFAYVSLYEGFGLPLVEAMSQGAAVVTSARSSMPEVTAGAAVLVDPFDVGAIAAGLREAMQRRDELGLVARRRAAERSWADAAAETVAVYDSARGS